MKWINISLLIIWVCLIAFGIFCAWETFDNVKTIAGGGYLYNDNGEVIGLWDRWEKTNFPHWMFVLAAPIILLTKMPVWWVTAFWSISAWFAFLIYINRPCISLE